MSTASGTLAGPADGPQGLRSWRSGAAHRGVGRASILREVVVSHTPAEQLEA